MDQLHNVFNILAFLSVLISALVGYKVQTILLKLKLPERLAVIEDQAIQNEKLILGLKDRMNNVEERQILVIKSMMPRDEYQNWHKQLQDRVDANYSEIGKKIDDLRAFLLGFGFRKGKDE